MTALTYLAESWSATEFRKPEITGYAEDVMREETRHGIQIMAVLSLVMQVCVPLFTLKLSLGPLHVYTYFVLGVLSLHVLVSSQLVGDVRALQFLGMVLLIVSALAITFLAHRTGSLNIAMMAAIVMLFVAMPLVPWGLREAGTVIALTYVLLTSSLISVSGRFDQTSIWTLQLLILGSSIVVMVVVARNAYTRKQDILTRYELEKARQEMELLSLKDHLTGAWNRRYLDTNFERIARRCRRDKKTLHVALLDIDDFKKINDSLGHHHADEILQALGKNFIHQLGTQGSLVRLGGDEFMILYHGNNIHALIDETVKSIQDLVPPGQAGSLKGVTLSAGFTDVDPVDHADLDEVYKAADAALYSAKHDRVSERSGRYETGASSRTGSWKL